MIGIKDLEIPKSCMDCKLNYDCCACIVTNTLFDFKKCDKERLDDCPLVEIKD